MSNPSFVASYSNSRSRRRQLRLQARRNARIHYLCSSTQHWNNQNHRRRQLKQQATLRHKNHHGNNEHQDCHINCGLGVDIHPAENSNRFSILQDQNSIRDFESGGAEKEFTFRIPVPWTVGEDITAPNSPSHNKILRRDSRCLTTLGRPAPTQITSTSALVDNADEKQMTTTLRYSNHYTIPSPLLYHRRSPDLCENLVNEKFTSDTAASHHQEIPALDLSNCDQRVHQDLAIDPTSEENPNEFIAAALPLMGSALKYHQRNSKRNDTSRASSTDSSSRSLFAPMGLHTQGVRSDSDKHHGFKDRSWTQHTIQESSLQRVPTGSGSVCPRKPESLLTARHHRSDAVYDDDPDYLNTAPLDYFDYQDPVFRLWLDFEHSMQHVDSKKIECLSAAVPIIRQASLNTRIMESKDLVRSANHAEATVEVTVCPAPTCLALIPATCGGHSQIQSGESLETLAISSNFMTVAKTIDCFAQDLGLDKEHAHNCCAHCSKSKEEGSETSPTDYIAVEDTDQDLPITYDSEQHSPMCFDPRVEPAADEGYHSGQDALSDVSLIELEEADTNDDDREDYEWEFLEENMGCSKIGHCATMWDNKSRDINQRKTGDGYRLS